MDPDIAERKMKRLATITAVAFLLLLGVVSWMMLYPFKTSVTTPHPYAIVGPEPHMLHQGDFGAYEYDIEKFTDQIPEVHKQFVDGIIFDASTVGPALSIGKTDGSVHVIAQFQIPETLPPGQYHIRISVAYKFFGIRVIKTVQTTETFTVLPSPTHYDELQDADRGAIEKTIPGK